MTAPDVDLVELTESTAATLARGGGDLFDNPIRPESLRAFLADPNHMLWFAVAEGVPIGFASGSILLHPDKPPQLFVNEVEVAEGFRRRGIGRALVARLIAEARARGCDYAWLGTATDNAGGNACFGSVPGAADAGRFVLWEWSLDRA